MPRSKEKPSFKHHLGPICTLVFESVVVLLLLTHLCAGQSQVVTPSQPIVATLGDDITLPCHLEPAKDATSETVEWARSDLDPRFVYVWRDGVELESKKHPSYVGRTSLSINKLKDGDISLKLDKVKVSDEGTYRCFVPTLQRESSVQLVVGATSSLIISLEKTDGDEDVSGAVLQCESKGWYPKPDVLWLDGEGKLLSAGRSETIRGPDGLYTVSSRVTVEKKHSKSFTCRVQQKNINQTRETTFYVSDDLFKFPSSSSALTAGFAVSLSLCILLILLLVFFLWRRKRYKSKKTHQLEEGREREQLMSAETEKVSQQLQEEQQRRKEDEDQVKNLEDQLETKNKELETKNKEHKGEIQKMEKELQTQKEELEKKIKEMDELNVGLQKVSKEKKKLENEKTKLEKIRTGRIPSLSSGLRKKQKEMEVETLKERLETRESELKTKVGEHKEEMKEKELQKLKEELEQKNKEVSQQLQEEQQRRKEAENKVKNLEDQLETKNKELETKNKELKGEIEEKEKELQTLKEELEQKKKEAGKQPAEPQQLSEEKQWNMELNEEIQRKEKELQILKEQWKETNQKLEKIRTGRIPSLSSAEKLQAGLQRLNEEIQKKEKELQTLKEKLMEELKKVREEKLQTEVQRERDEADAAGQEAEEEKRTEV